MEKTSQTENTRPRRMGLLRLIAFGGGLLSLVLIVLAVWVCPVSADCLPLSHGISSQSNLFVL